MRYTHILYKKYDFYIRMYQRKEINEEYLRYKTVKKHEKSIENMKILFIKT